jgi:hypothetical protein
MRCDAMRSARRRRRRQRLLNSGCTHFVMTKGTTSMVFYISEGSPDTVLSDARIGELLQQVHHRPLQSAHCTPPPAHRLLHTSAGACTARRHLSPQESAHCATRRDARRQQSRCTQPPPSSRSLSPSRPQASLPAPRTSTCRSACVTCCQVEPQSPPPSPGAAHPRAALGTHDPMSDEQIAHM